MNIILLRIIGAVVTLIAAFLFGVLYEHGKLEKLKGELQGAANIQKQVVKAADTKNEGEAHVAQQNYVQAINDLDAYYRTHPVVRVQHTNTCAVPQTTANPQGTDGAAPDGNAATYSSPYRPEDTELIAIQLFLLQQLLLADGVMVK